MYKHKYQKGTIKISDIKVSKEYRLLKSANIDQM